jgi:hypothetical protein
MNRQRKALRNESDRRTALLQLKNTRIRAAKLAFPTALYIEAFFPRVRVEPALRALGIGVEGATHERETWRKR